MLSHVRLSEHTADVTCSRIVTGTADLVLAADEVVAAAKDTITLCESSRTVGIINSHVIPTADFILNRDFNFQARNVNTSWKLRCARIRHSSISQNPPKRCSAIPSPPTS